MTGRDPAFATLKRDARRRLAAAVPALLEHPRHPAVDAMATILATSSLRLGTALRDHRLEADLRVSPAPDRDRLAAALIDLVRRVIDSRTTSTKPAWFDLGSWLDTLGYLDLVAELAAEGADVATLARLADLVGGTIATLRDRVEQLATDHAAAVLQRDLPWHRRTGARAERDFDERILWLLAPDHAGDCRRPLVVEQRVQAFTTYGSINSILREAPITAVIDRAEPLVPALRERLAIGKAQLRRLRGARPRATSLSTWGDYSGAVVELVAHAVPLAAWPQPNEWARSPWIKSYDQFLYRFDIVGTGTEAKDALSALAEDILFPLARSRAVLAGMEGRFEASSFVNGFRMDAALAASPARRRFLAALSRGVIGERGATGFAEAVERWHRRAACAAAIRHEQAAERPGWPALCDPWTTLDQRHSIVPLVTADDLVAEGNALDHCVGGYYGRCRSGDTQILSLREDGKRVATIELLIGERLGGGLTLSVGQFRTHRNCRPADRHQLVLRAFVADLEHGRHAVARGPLTLHRKKQREHGDNVWRRSALTLDHAARAWPLYAALLPRPGAATPQEWAAACGLDVAIDEVLSLIVTRRDATKRPGA